VNIDVLAALKTWSDGTIHPPAQRSTNTPTRDKPALPSPSPAHFGIAVPLSVVRIEPSVAVDIRGIEQ